MSGRTWVALGLAGLVVAGCMRTEPTTPASQSRPAPPVQGLDADNRPMKLADFAGQVVLLDFWFTE